MGFFANSGPGRDNVTLDIESATNENNTEDNWAKIISICDKAGKSPEIAKAFLRAIVKRLYNQDPHIGVQAVTLLDACVKNCDKIFHVEVASREFEIEFNRLMTKGHPAVAKKLRESLKKWAENEFKTDQQLTLIPSLYTKLKSSGMDFSSSEMPVKKSAPVSKDPNVVETKEEEEQIMKAIELSLKETTGSPRTTTSSLYPTANLSAAASASTNSTPVKEPKKVRALYDFEAAEENELTFSSGEIIFVIDDSDTNWWKGSNQRGEGLFPSNFVTSDLNVEPEKFLYEKAKKIVQFKDSDGKPSEKETEEVEVDETKVDRLLHLLHEADPTNPETDTDEMLKLEREVNRMGPLIDSELERVDRKHAQLTQLSADLVEALGFYHSLMREVSYAPINKMGPYRFNEPPPHTSMGYNGGSMPPGMSPAHSHMLPPMSAPGVMPPGPGQDPRPPYMPQNMHYHHPGMNPMGPYGSLPHGMSGMPGPGPGLPPNMMPPNYVPGMVPPSFPPAGPPTSQTLIHNGHPQGPGPQYLPPSNTNNPK